MPRRAAAPAAWALRTYAQSAAWLTVGASRRDLCAAALLEGVVLALAALGLGFAFGVPGHGLAVATWPGGATHGSTGPAVGVLVALGGAIVLGAILPAVFAGSGRRGMIVGALPQGLVLPAVQLGGGFTAPLAATPL